MGPSHRQHRAIALPCHLLHPAPQEELDPLGGEGALQGPAHLLVLVRQQVGHQLHDGYLHAIGVIQIGELTARSAAAYDDRGGWKLLALQGLPAGHDHLSIQRKVGQRACAGSCGEDDVIRLQRILRAVQRQAGAALQDGLPFDALYLVFAQQQANSTGQLFHYLAAPVYSHAEIGVEAVKLKAELLGATQKR